MKHIASALFCLLCCSHFAHAQNGPYAFTDPAQATREYYLHLPSNMPANAPLVFVLHGWTGNGQQMMNTTNFNTVADTYGFAVCYPTGLEIDGETAWNTVGSSDINFILALADTLIAQHNLDASRVYSCGFSWGGEMSHHLACQRGDRFAAIASVGGSLFADESGAMCFPQHNTSVLQIHGTNDDEIEYNGGFFLGLYEYWSVDAIIAHWNGINSAQFVDSTQFPDLNSDSIYTDVYRYEASTEHRVWLYKVNDGVHEWFKASPAGTTDIDASEEIWLFFAGSPAQPVSVPEVTPSTAQREHAPLVSIRNLLGQEVVPQQGQPQLLLFVYSDGHVEKQWTDRVSPALR